MPVNRNKIQRGRGSRQAFFVRLVLLASLILPTVGVHHFLSYDENAGNQWEKDRVIAKSDPLQSILETADPITLEKSGAIWRMIPRADYQITARVLHSMGYEDWQADFTPVDLALGWGKMSDPAVDRWIEWRQADRWYFYRRQKNSPLSMEDIRNFSANVHIIPATEELAAQLQQLRPNDTVLMEGKLVDVEVDRQGQMVRFQTSLSRSDSADNSCEIFYVERLTIN